VSLALALVAVLLSMTTVAAAQVTEHKLTASDGATFDEFAQSVQFSAIAEAQPERLSIRDGIEPIGTSDALLSEWPANLDISEEVRLMHTEAVSQSLGGAWSLSILGTLVPIGVGVAVNSDDVRTLLIPVGLLVGPSVGHFYLGDVKRGLIGVGIRVGGIGAAVLLGFAIFGDEYDGGGFEFALIGSGVAILVGSIYSFVTLDDSARERGYVLTPGVTPDGMPSLTLAVDL